MGVSFVPIWTVSRITRQPVCKKVVRPSLDDVERISRGQAAKRRGTGSRSVPHRLNEDERRQYELAIQKGFLTLGSNVGHRRERKGSPLYNIWRMWNDAQVRPTIMIIKRRQPSSRDQTWIDLSTLRDQLDLIAPSLQHLVQTLDGAVEADGLVERDDEFTSDDAASLNGNDLFLPTWRLPEIWIKYHFDDLSDAKRAAQVVVRHMFGDKLSKKSSSKKRTTSKPPVDRDSLDSFDGQVDLFL